MNGCQESVSGSRHFLSLQSTAFPLMKVLGPAGPVPSSDGRGGGGLGAGPGARAALRSKVSGLPAKTPPAEVNYASPEASRLIK